MSAWHINSAHTYDYYDTLHMHNIIVKIEYCIIEGACVIVNSSYLPPDHNALTIIFFPG